MAFAKKTRHRRAQTIGTFCHSLIREKPKPLLNNAGRRLSEAGSVIRPDGLVMEWLGNRVEG